MTLLIGTSAFELGRYAASAPFGPLVGSALSAIGGYRRPLPAFGARMAATPARQGA